MIKQLFKIGGVLLLVVLGFFSGVVWNELEAIEELENQIREEGEKRGRILNGLYLYGFDNISSVKAYAKSRDKRGDWVCINVAYEMTYAEAYKTCVHECSHKAFSEIYAEDCEKYPEKCWEIINNG